MNRYASILVAGLAAVLAAPAFAAGTDRAGTWEFYGGLRALLGETVDFDGGSAIETDDDIGVAFGGGYNLNEHLNVGGEMSWSSVDYDGTVVSADNPGNSASLSGEMDVFTLGANAAWNFLEGPLTPYVNANLGYTWIDTNIATGPPQLGCWWDPWWGYVCDYFVDTKDEDAFSYGVGLGVRWDFTPGWFARLSYQERWFDVGEADGTPSFGSVQIDVGSKF